MVPVISQRRWRAWCSAKGLDISAVGFALETCYFGCGFRSRPGTLIVVDGSITHYSYSVWNTYWALGEKSIRVDMPRGDIHAVVRKRMSMGLRLVQLFPEALFEVQMHDGTIYHLSLERGSVGFVSALAEAGVALAGE